MTAELACWLLWLTDSVDGGGTDMSRTIAAEVVDHAPDSSSEEALLEKTLRGTASGKSSAPVLKRKIRPSAVRGGGGDESAFAGEADEEEFEDEQHQNFRRSSPPAAKRSKKKQPGDSLHRKGGTLCRSKRSSRSELVMPFLRRVTRSFSAVATWNGPFIRRPR